MCTTCVAHAWRAHGEQRSSSVLTVDALSTGDFPSLDSRVHNADWLASILSSEAPRCTIIIADVGATLNGILYLVLLSRVRSALNGLDRHGGAAHSRGERARSAEGDRHVEGEERNQGEYAWTSDCVDLHQV